MLAQNTSYLFCTSCLIVIQTDTHILINQSYSCQIRCIHHNRSQHNPAGLLKLEMTYSHKELVDSLKELKDKVAALEAEMPKFKSAYANSLAIRNRFFSSFLRDHHPAQYTPGEHKKVAGDHSARHRAPLLDPYLYTDAVRSDVNTFVILYGLRPDQIEMMGFALIIVDPKVVKREILP